MPAHRDIDPALLRRARYKELRRSNTVKGSIEQAAVNRITYLRRRAAHPELTARQALGHPAAGDRPPQISLMVDNPPRWIITEALNRRDLTRAGRYDNLVSQLDTGRLSHNAFRRRVSSWRPIAGLRFLSDPDAVLAILQELRASDQMVFHYESGRSG